MDNTVPINKKVFGDGGKTGNINVKVVNRTVPIELINSWDGNADRELITKYRTKVK